MLILTIESSCDETSAAVIRGGWEILSNAVASQIPVHRRYGGVVPELASRNHIRDVHTVLEEALEEAGVELGEIEGIGVTVGPGLVGSLLVGIETAKGLAYGLGCPCVGLNHLEGHLTAVLLDTGQEVPEFPYVGLIVSGGHTDLYVVRGLGDYELLGRTRDDAAGEAFDKVAKMLGLPYPGGVVIDELSEEGDPKAVEFPRPMWTRENLDFSFSGLKTAVARHLEEEGLLRGQDLKDLCASFQEAVVDVLVMKGLHACESRGLKRWVISGGVACNRRLREVAMARSAEAGVELFVAPPRLCTDNAAMLGPVAAAALREAEGCGFELKARATMPLGRGDRAVGARHR